MNQKAVHFCGATALLLVTGCGGSATTKGSFSGSPSASSGSQAASGAFLPSAGSSIGGSGASVLGPGTTGTSGGDAGVTGDPRCPGGGTTTISGTVYDPGAQDPLYNITVFIPDPSSPLPKMPVGASCNACADLYPKVIVASAVTDDHGNFTMTKANPGPVIPAGSVTLVTQTGKWRRQTTVNVTACKDNHIADKTLHLPTDATQGDLPDVAISTGNADSLECLPLRLGVSASEYVGGAGGPGHIHIFQGSNGATTRPAGPGSTAALWNSTPNLLKNDVVLLSCEGGEPGGMTAPAQQSMYDYALGGGRIFASHFHYAWFSDKTNTGPVSPFGKFPLATWSPGGNNIQDAPLPADVVQTLNVGGGPFPEGIALFNWLGVVSALTPTNKINIYFTRHNADVGPINTPSQPWIVLDSTVPPPDTSATQYFSFDTPIGAAGVEKCGRVVFSDIHVSGGNKTVKGFPADYANGNDVPTGCAMHPLTAQEKALEFMFFDLSSCLQPVGQPPATIVTPPPR